MPDSRTPKQAFIMLTRSNIPEDLNWGRLVQQCLSSLGFAYKWNCNGRPGINKKHVLKSLKQRMRDCFLQEWRSSLSNSSRFSFYRSFRTDFEYEKYISFINVNKCCDSFIRFRVGWNDLPSNVRNKSDANISTECPFCSEKENELYFLRNCRMYIDLRNIWINIWLIPILCT